LWPQHHTLPATAQLCSQPVPTADGAAVTGFTSEPDFSLPHPNTARIPAIRKAPMRDCCTTVYPLSRLSGPSLFQTLTSDHAGLPTRLAVAWQRGISVAILMVVEYQNGDAITKPKVPPSAGELRIDSACRGCQAVVTGEGQLDASSLEGKLPVVVAGRACDCCVQGTLECPRTQLGQ